MSPSTATFSSGAAPAIQRIRTAIIDGASWFIAIDVCKALGRAAAAAHSPR